MPSRVAGEPQMQVLFFVRTVSQERQLRGNWRAALLKGVRHSHRMRCVFRGGRIVQDLASLTPPPLSAHLLAS